jgi:hypothetical protein
MKMYKPNPVHFARTCQSVKAVPCSNQFIDRTFSTDTVSLSDVQTAEQNIPLESFCALNPELEKQRRAIVARQVIARFAKQYNLPLQ